MPSSRFYSHWAEIDPLVGRPARKNPSVSRPLWRTAIVITLFFLAAGRRLLTYSLKQVAGIALWG